MDVNLGLDRYSARPDAYLPLTRANAREHLPLLMGQMFSLRLSDLAEWRGLLARLYTNDAVFDYPAALLRGRAEILRFWTAFLALRALQRLDVFNVNTSRVVFDPATLEAMVELEAHQNWAWLRWLDWLAACVGLIRPGQQLTTWKVWSVQVLWFEEDPDTRELTISHQTELIDQFVLFGALLGGAVLVRAQPGMPLAALLLAARSIAGR
ncbi:MAG: hypothetical protein J3K34DRAFT_149114 [Monoraphidium minutum]|nr:MAG: hypothetical protein J3K34DRAFT_149114 [Monoraphidium minutum]